MRISKGFFSVKALLLGLALAVPAMAVNEDAFYEKEHIRGFIGIGADYRGMTKSYASYINKLLLGKDKGKLETVTVTETTGTGEDATEEEVEKTSYTPASSKGYSKFDNYYFPDIHINLGAQYRQFMTWFDINFMFSSCSEGSGAYDACWYNYGVDWMFGWKIFGENTFFNLIPSAGIGFNILNVHFTDTYDVVAYHGETGTDFDESKGTMIDGMGNRYYSTISPTFAAELEARLEFDPISIGLYGGYRWIRWNEIDIEGTKYGSNDVNGDTWFIGLRLQYKFMSIWQKKQHERL